MQYQLVDKSRVGWIDALRGLAILFVMYGHSVRGGVFPEFFTFTSPVKMPLFFAISGYLFKPNVGFDKYSVQLIKKIVIPWFGLGLLSIIPVLPIKGFGYGLDFLLNMISGKALWFMPCFLFSQIIHFLIRKCTNMPLSVIILSFVCFALGMIAHHFGVLNFAMINRAMAVQPFYIIGFVFRRFETRIKAINWSWLGGAYALYFILCYLSKDLFPVGRLDIHLNLYFNIPYCFCLIFLGCFILFITASKSNCHSWIMSFLGQNTLVLYIMHGLFIGFLVLTMETLGYPISKTIWTAVIKVIWACLCCGLLSVILNRYLPEIVGKRRIE